MRLRSIGGRLTLWYTGLLAATLLILGVSTYFLLSYSLQREVDASLNSVAAAMAERAKEGRELSGIEQLFRRYFGFAPPDPYFEMLDPEGKRRTRADRARSLLLTQLALDNASRGISTYETIELPNTYPIRVLTRPVILEGKVVSLVQAGMSLERTHRTGNRFLLILTAMLPLGLVLAGGGGWLLARRSLRPIALMTQTAQRISAFHLSERLEESGTGDELDQLARTLNESLERLDESFHQMRQFSADASHELQTPLTVLKGEIEVALRSPRSNEEYRNTLKSALEEIDRLARLVEGLLLLARADSGVLQIDRQSVDLPDLIRRVHSELTDTAKERGVDLEKVTEESVKVSGDPILLRQLVQNLVHNGLKYTPRGGHVTVSCRRDNESALLEVSDTGQGVPEPEQERIFQRFYRATEARSDRGGGAGLGLSIVRSIAEVHGGEVSVLSHPGKRSRFTVRLPLGDR
jgi:heavy metal sensor kinase